MLAVFQVSEGQTGTNPIYKDAFTADPSPFLYNGVMYVYVGHDEAYNGEATRMTEWLCYSTTDMKNWTNHGAVMKPTDFKWASKDAWAAQVVE
ncbi:MAG: glycoside hydrolase, partial [Opitutaceae bacterium]|nr:glycoside hydrolase [Cytophagales bacterium]